MVCLPCSLTTSIGVSCPSRMYARDDTASSISSCPSRYVGASPSSWHRHGRRHRRPRLSPTLTTTTTRSTCRLQPAIEFFRSCSPIDGRTPPDVAKAVKAALAEALVYYYPLAGRLRGLPDGKLAVECTGEGVVFVEADADVSMEQLGDPPLPPYPCVEELLCDVGDTRVVVGAPLFFMQVELNCTYIRASRFMKFS